MVEALGCRAFVCELIVICYLYILGGLGEVMVAHCI